MYLSFKDALLETSVEAILQREFKLPFKLNETKTQIELIIFVVPYKERKSGKATEFVNRVIELGKMANKDIVLTATDGYLNSEGDMNLKQLKSWYKKLGFERQTGKFDHIYKV